MSGHGSVAVKGCEGHLVEVEPTRKLSPLSFRFDLDAPSPSGLPLIDRVLSLREDGYECLIDYQMAGYLRTDQRWLPVASLLYQFSVTYRDVMHQGQI